MKKYITATFILLSFLLIASSCEKKEEQLYGYEPLKFTIDNEEFQLPFKFETLDDKWSINAEDDFVSPNSTATVTFECDSGAVGSFVLRNNSKQEMPIEDCDVVFVSFVNDGETVIELYGGIKMYGSVESITKTYGEPDDRYFLEESNSERIDYISKTDKKYRLTFYTSGETIVGAELGYSPVKNKTE